MAEPIPPQATGSLCREELDDRCVFFLDHLPAGRREIRHAMRAVFAGDFRALPVTAEAMYVPVIAAHSIATRLRVVATGRAIPGAACRMN